MSGNGDYISREAAIANSREYNLGGSYDNTERAVPVDAINSIPAADVRPVVLCKDCVHFQRFRPHDGFCNIDGMLWNNDFFCVNGERKEN